MARAVEPVPSHLHTVTPRLVFEHTDDAIAFYERAFGATLREEPHRGPDGIVVHAELRIGDSTVYLTDQGDPDTGVAPATVGGRVTALMAVTVPDVDRLFAQAVAAGCDVMFPLADQFYGERGGRVKDPFGHQWMLATHIEDVDRAELDRRMAAWSDESA
jgi:PhnB protein